MQRDTHKQRVFRECVMYVWLVKCKGEVKERTKDVSKQRVSESV